MFNLDVEFDNNVCILPIGIALICSGAGALNSMFAIRDTFVTRDDPIREARKAATNAVNNIGKDTSPSENSSCRSYNPENGKYSFSFLK